MEEDKFFRCLGCGATITEAGSTFTLRDFFAGCVLTGLMAFGHSALGKKGGDDGVASAAYHMADTMLKARGE